MRSSSSIPMPATPPITSTRSFSWPTPGFSWIREGGRAGFGGPTGPPNPTCSAPDVGDGGGVGGRAGVREAVCVLDGAQHVVVVDVLGVGAGLHAGAGDDGGDDVGGGVVVLVEGE